MFGFLTPLMPYKYLIMAVVAIAILAGVYFKGRNDVNVLWQAERDANKLKIAKTEVKRAEVTIRTITEYVDRVKIVKEKGNTVIQYIDRIIDSTDEANCKITPHMIAAHNAAAANMVVDVPVDAVSAVDENLESLIKRHNLLTIPNVMKESK